MKYIALLRGINVSGQRKIKMADLKTLFESLGLQEVVTYIQSGNVIFETEEEVSALLKKKIEHAITAQYGFEVPVLLRSASSWKSMVNAYPFEEIDPMENATKVLVTLLEHQPTQEAITSLDVYVQKPDRLVVLKDHVYLYTPNG